MTEIHQETEILESFVQVASSPKELAEQCEVVLAMLADPAAAEEVGQQIAEGISQGETLTCSDKPMKQRLVPDTIGSRGSDKLQNHCLLCASV